MFTGDSLSVLLFLVGSALAGMMGALTAPPGWRSSVLWGITILFALASLGWLIAPTASPIITAASPILTALARSNVWILLATVGVVALIQPRRTTLPAQIAASTEHAHIKAPNLPDFAVADVDISKWVPDTSLIAAVMYIADETRWSSSKAYSAHRDVEGEVRGALISGKLTAWAKAHPNDPVRLQVRSRAWMGADTTLDKNYAFFHQHGEEGHDIHLARGQVEAAYPAKINR